ncbi:MAG: SAM-dependent DNA methyltransferase [Planctomycetes bacterium]|nr:SAM-dependent DNA methyltransferase [Planctomycetota bacterium]
MRLSVADLERLISGHARTMAEAMLAAARAAGSEEDIRHECNKLIDQFIGQAGLQVKGRHEYSIGGGRLDSKYQGVLLEYKHPKGPQRITEDAAAPGTAKAVAEIKQRIEDFERDEGYRPERLLGVGCDGDTILFVRYRSGKWEVEDPKPVTRHTVEHVLRALVSLGAQGHSFTPERLAEDFGADSSVPAAAIAALYRAITQTRSRKAKMFFNQWRLLFGEVCGYDIEGKNPKVAKLASHYHLAGGEPAPLLFAVHSYYAILMKLLAAEIAGSFSPLGTSVLRKCVGAATNAQLRRDMAQLEQGGIWTQLGITNFLEGDLFSWYLAAWTDEVADAVRSIARALDDYDPATLSVDPPESRDLLKKLYHHLLPRTVRRALGEYYTPDWLAEHVLNEVGYDGDPNKRVLDPACGSGTFLVTAINRVKAWFEEHAHECGFGERELIAKIQSNVVGFDLNPLAVMAARTNYLLAVRDFLRFAPRLDIPVYLCDSVMTPAEHGELFAAKGARRLRTAAGEFIIPGEIARDRQRVARYADTLEFCIRNKYPRSDFLLRCQEEGLPVAEGPLHAELYEQLRLLDAEDQNGIWARIIKNAFAPLFVGRVDFVVGNPPWVNWRHLPEAYREAGRPVWRRYNLHATADESEGFGLGMENRDLSALFLYACVDHYLQHTGKLGFLITQTLFKTPSGEVFRKFRLSQQRFIVPERVADLSAMQVFELAHNRTALIVCRYEPSMVRYPVPYVMWHGPSRLRPADSLEDVLAQTYRTVLDAVPIDPKRRHSPWLTLPHCTSSGVRKAIGEGSYAARAGCATWLNGVYWVRALGSTPSGRLLIENLSGVGKKAVESTRVAVEADLVYPLLRGRDVVRWHAQPAAHILFPHSRQTGWRPLDPTVMRTRFPNAYAYLLPFKTALEERSGYRKLRAGQPFYVLGNTNPEIMSSWKVVWGDMGDEIAAAVLPSSGPKPVIPDHHVMYVPLARKGEAHYLCALLNSAPARLAIASFTIATGMMTHLLAHLAIAPYDDRNPAHRALSRLSQRCHGAAGRRERNGVVETQAQIDRAAAELWGITPAELEAIQAALTES